MTKEYQYPFSMEKQCLSIGQRDFQLLIDGYECKLFAG